MGFLFEKLDVYQRAVGLAEEVFRITDGFPRGHAALVDQFKRAALSIPANIAEGNGRWHRKDRRNFFLIARGSLFECVPLLELCRRRKLLEEGDFSRTKDELDTLAKMLTQLIRGTENRPEQ